MTLRHLRIFIEVVNCGKMSEAASRLFVSQSSISQAVSELEEHYHIKLFDRLSKRIFLTSAGEELYGLASKVILTYDEMERYMENITDRQVLNVGATFTIGATILMQLFRALSVECPNVSTKAIVDRTSVLERQLLRGELDVALVEGAIKSPDLLVCPVIEDELVLVCAPTHPFAKRRQVSLKELEGQDFIMRESSSKTWKIFESYLLQGNVKVTEKWICNNLETIKAAVIGGYGLSVLSARYIREETKKGTMVEIPIKDVHMLRDFSLVYHKSKYPFSAFQKFISLCQEYGKHPESFEVLQRDSEAQSVRSPSTY